MSKSFTFDFEMVAAATRSQRGKKPFFRVSELDKAVLSGPVLAQNIVQFYAYDGYGELRLPLENRTVRAWLKKQVFTAPPCIGLGASEVPVGKEVDAPQQLPVRREHLVCIEDATVCGILREDRHIIYRPVRSEEPPFAVGDMLLVRESMARRAGQVLYRADQEQPYTMGLYWCKTWHMPVEHVRLRLEVTDVYRDPQSPEVARWAVEVSPYLLLDPAIRLLERREAP